MKVAARHVVIYSVLTLSSWSINAQGEPWTRRTIDASFSGADGVRLADVNGDGLQDITTGWEEGGYTVVYLHPGLESVTEEWPSVIVGRTPSVEDAVFADLNGDGSLDVVSSTEGRNRKVYVNWAPSLEDYLDSSLWRTQVLPASEGMAQWMFAATAQIDGIHGVDLVVGSKNRGGQISWFQSPEDPMEVSKWSWHTIGPCTWVMSLIMNDMDGDGDVDVVVSDRKTGPTTGVRWLENPGDAERQKQPWENHFIGGENLEVMFMDLADLDGDGLEDAIVTERTTQKVLFLRRLDKTGLNWESFQIDVPEATGRAKAVKVGDVNGDGRPDLVHATNTGNDRSKVGLIWMSFADRPTDQTWEWHHLSGMEGYKFDRIELLDMDGDGDLDVLTCEENYGANSEGLGVIWYENPFEN